jgi:type IV pilus assembly protein PilV
MIAWRENEKAELTEIDKQNTDGTRVRDGDNGPLLKGADGAATCPPNHTCHLQYIPISTRCAPYKAGNGAIKYFCAGA